ncbi:MAG: hypothetical protein V4506_07715 [Bacteroidota bacterium]
MIKQKPDVVDIKPSLEQCLKNRPYCSMIFSPKIHPENQNLKEGNYYTNYLYAAITSSLEKNNIVVDGTKLNSALYGSDKLITDHSYAPKKFIDDLLIEFVGFEAFKYYANKTDINKDLSRKEIKLLKKQCFIGQKLEFKIIHVLTGETVGHFIYYYTPCTNGCDLSTGKSNSTGQLNKKTGTTINVDETYKIFEPLLQRFTRDLLKYKNDSVVTVPGVSRHVQSHNIMLMYHPDNSSITFESGNGLTYNLTITNYLGTKIVDAPVTDKRLLNLNHLPPDTYFLEIKFNSIVVKNEIIKVIDR